MAIFFFFCFDVELNGTNTTPTGKMMATSRGNNIKARLDIVRIVLVGILTLGLSLSNACAALSSLELPPFCEADTGISHQVDHVKKTSCKLRPCNPEQDHALLTQELAEIRDSKGSHLFPATILLGRFGTIMDPADYRRKARTHFLYPSLTDSPPIYIKLCSFLC